MKRKPWTGCKPPKGILNLPWSGDRNESEVIASVICSVYALKYEMINSILFVVMSLEFNPLPPSQRAEIAQAEE
jgi:hypothetical protein